MAIRATFDVFSNYTRGPKAGHVNPRSKASVTLTAASVKAAVKRLNSDIVPDLYQIKKVVGVEEEQEAA